MADRYFTQTQVRGHLITAGASVDEVNILSAIAMVEGASHDPTGYANFDAVGDVALQDNTWGPSITYFQIRTLNNPGSLWYRTAALLKTPDQACKAALHIARTAGYSAWSVFRSGAYLAYVATYLPPVGVYILKSGDTLYRLGERFGIPWKVIAIANNVPAPYNTLRIGDRLHIYKVHIVSAGQTLYGISRDHGVPMDKIVEYNNLLNPNVIVTGQVLKIPKVY